MSNLKNTLFQTPKISLNTSPLSRNQILTLTVVIILSFIIRVLLIPYNQFDGEAVTRVWNALWWSQHPYFILPGGSSIPPFWFYFMGSIIAISKDIYYAPILTMTAIMTLAGFYLFKTACLVKDFKTGLLTLVIFLFTPAIFRLNYTPYTYAIPAVCFCIVLYYFISALNLDKPVKHFSLAGIFCFIALFTRAESLFIILCLCAVAAISGRQGRYAFITIALFFQVFWSLLGTMISGSPFAIFQTAADYPNLWDIHGLNLALRLRGFLLPYLFLLAGTSFIIIYFFLRGLKLTFKEYPKVIGIIILIPILVPALINGIVSVWTSAYHTTQYIFPEFFFASIFSAVGLDRFLQKFKNYGVRTALASFVIVTAVPLSYVKEIIPAKFKTLYPKVVQVIATTPEPYETNLLCKFLDDKIESYPSLIFDYENSGESSILYIAYRSKLAPPDKVLISKYNVPDNKQEAVKKISSFMNDNKKGIIIVRKKETMFSEIFNDNLFNLKKVLDLEKWNAYTYELTIN